MIKTIQLTKRLIQFMRHLSGRLALAVSFAVFGFIATLAIPGIILYTAFTVLDKQVLSWVLLPILIVIALLRGACRYGEHYYGHYIAFRVLADFRRIIFQKLRRLAPAKLDTQDSGALLKMIGEDIEALEVFFAHTLAPMLTASLTTVIVCFYFLTYNSLLAMIALCTYIILAIIVPFVFARVIGPLLQRQHDARKNYMSVFLDDLKGMKDLVQYQQVDTHLAVLQEQSKLVNAQERQVAIAQYQQQVMSFFVIGLAIMVFAGYSFMQVQAEQFSVATSAIGIALFSSSFAPYLELGRLPLGFKKAMHAAEHVFSLLDEVEPVQEASDTLATTLDQVRYDDVHFTYEQREQMVLSDVTVHFDNNQLIGIVGQSGSGKSTLMKLLMKWYNVSSGQLVINQHNAQQLDAYALQKHIAYIPQKPQLFKQTIRENLTLGQAISDEAILAMADKCHIKTRILETEHGLDTVLDTENSIFSAGEQQRLELTRALLKNADCYIFDEPTSHLDALNEAAFLTLIKEHCKGLVFLISHRASTVMCADVLYELVDGQLKQVQKESYYEN